VQSGVISIPLMIFLFHLLVFENLIMVIKIKKFHFFFNKRYFLLAIYIGSQTYPAKSLSKNHTMSFNQDNTFIEFKTTKGKQCIGYLTDLSIDLNMNRR
ncbi:hypothetical protein BpHYR1_027388, partial [Brachionus plicatilis]